MRPYTKGPNKTKQNKKTEDCESNFEKLIRPSNLDVFWARTVMHSESGDLRWRCCTANKQKKHTVIGSKDAMPLNKSTIEHHCCKSFVPCYALHVRDK